LWTELTPHVADAYSWVGYDIDGRTDISWGDALRLRLSEKDMQLERYLKASRAIQSKGGLKAKSEAALDTLVDKLSDASESAKRDLTLFEKDITRPDNLVAAANNLTRTSSRRFTNLNSAIALINEAISGSDAALTAQIHKYIDDTTPIRLLIAETEDSLVPLGVLYLARLYGLENHLDISPLFETADALNNGGRIIGKMLNNSAYRDYVKARGVFAIQTGFSDAGRFMGQIPATLAIERLHSHFANQMAKYEMQDVTALVFNTHGEGLGRGGHPGSIVERVNYAMSPWAVHQFEKRGIHLCHEVSFQGGDGFLWFQTPQLSGATTQSLVSARYADRSKAGDDSFYTENDFSWDIFRAIGSEQDSLYRDPNYITLLGGFGQNLLIPTGSRAGKLGACT